MAHATVKLPSPLRPYAENSAELTMDGATVGGIVRALADRYPPLRRHLFTPGGELRNFVTIYLNDQDVRYLQREATELKEGDIVSIVPALAGGAPDPGRKENSPAPDGPPLTRAELIRYSRHLLLPEVGLAGQKKLRSSKVLLVGTGGLGSPGGPLPRGRGRGGDRARRLRPGRRVEPAASGDLRDVGRGSPEDLGRGRTTSGPEPGDPGRGARDTPLLRECPRDPPTVRRRDRRFGQLPDPVPGQRCLRPPRQTRRVRLDLSVRRTGKCFRRPHGTMLPVPLPRTPASGRRPLLRRGRRSRRAPGTDRNRPGDRGPEAPSGDGRIPRGSVVAVRSR